MQECFLTLAIPCKAVGFGFDIGLKVAKGSMEVFLLLLKEIIAVQVFF